MLSPIRKLTTFVCLVALACATWSCQSDLPPDPASEALARGTEALNQMQFAEANQHLTEAIELDSTLADAYLKRGQIRWMAQSHKSAVEDLDRALALDSTLGWGYFFRGSSLFALDSLDFGLRDLGLAATSEDLPAQDRARAYRMRGIVFMQDEDYEAGIEELGAAIDLRPDHAFFHYERGLLLAAAGFVEEAAADLEHYIGATTADSEALDHARSTLDSLRSIP